MRPGFTAKTQSSQQIKATLQTGRKNPQAQLLQVKLMWAEKFNLPPNDERLSALTAREAIEQILGLAALREHLEENRQEDKRESTNHFDENAPPDVTVRTDEEARKLADTPHLTGDPEWDAMELAETDPSRPTLAERGMV